MNFTQRINYQDNNQKYQSSDPNSRAGAQTQMESNKDQKLRQTIVIQDKMQLKGAKSTKRTGATTGTQREQNHLSQLNQSNIQQQEFNLTQESLSKISDSYINASFQQISDIQNSRNGKKNVFQKQKVTSNDLSSINYEARNQTVMDFNYKQSRNQPVSISLQKQHLRRTLLHFSNNQTLHSIDFKNFNLNKRFDIQSQFHNKRYKDQQKRQSLPRSQFQNDEKIRESQSIKNSRNSKNQKHNINTIDSIFNSKTPSCNQFQLAFDRSKFRQSNTLNKNSPIHSFDVSSKQSKENNQSSQRCNDKKQLYKERISVQDRKKLFNIIHNCSNYQEEKQLETNKYDISENTVNKARFVSLPNVSEINKKQIYEKRTEKEFNHLNQYMKFEKRPAVQKMEEYKNQKGGCIDETANQILQKYNIFKSNYINKDEKQIQPIKQDVLLHKLEIQKYMEDIRTEKLLKTQEYLKEYQDFKEPTAVWMVYQYNSNYDHDYERTINEVIQEHKDGIIDPSRIAGKAERKRGAARKAIEAIKRKYQKMGKMPIFSEDLV